VADQRRDEGKCTSVSSDIGCPSYINPLVVVTQPSGADPQSKILFQTSETRDLAQC
jgi:hypothetical protein